MKFRADEKDWIMFGCFCLFLLYMCAIGVLNASYLATEGKFYGLLPFKAFTGKYIGATLVLFMLGLVGSFAAVSSYFFEREKGFGFSTQKKDKGYSRWAKDNEIKRELVEVDPKAYTTNAGGLPVINNGKKMWVDDGEAHNIIVGSTGSGKTQGVVLPLVQSLAKNSESMIITDPKGEIYEQTANMLKEREYNIIVLNFRNPQNGNAWNPLTLPYRLYKEGNMDKAIEILDDLALNILYDENNKGEPFWEKASADYFSGLALGLFEDGTESQININSINLMSSLGEERFGGPNNNYIKEYFNAKDPSRPAYINASGVVYTAEDTKQGVIATFKQKVKLFSSRDNLSEMLSYSDFDMRDIGRKKTAVFMIIQDEKKTLHPLATIFIKQCYETLIDVAQESGGKLPVRTNFILDEFANMPPLKDVTTMVTAARSRQVRFTFIIQNFAQLNDVYGKEDAETIRSNCGNLIYLLTTELAALEEISKLCGEKKSKEKDKTASTPLVTVSDLQKMKLFEAIIMRSRLNPFKTKLKPSFEIDWGEKFPLADFPERTKGEIGIFDLKDFVNKRRKDKVMNGMNNDSNPFGGVSFDRPANPFVEGGFNPFITSPQQNPSADMVNPFQNGGGEVDVDELLKKIDAKIAELEEEERLEKGKGKKEEVLEEPVKKDMDKVLEEFKFDLDESMKEKDQNQSVEPKEDVLKTFNDILMENSNALQEDKKEVGSNTIINNTNSSDSNITDDQYFDDFFQDE